MQKISREEFHDVTGGMFVLPPGMITESGWFRHSDDFVGLVLTDSIDGDWLWVGFRRRPGPYSAYDGFDIGTGCPSFDDATLALERAIAANTERGKRQVRIEGKIALQLFRLNNSNRNRNPFLEPNGEGLTGLCGEESKYGCKTHRRKQ